MESENIDLSNAEANKVRVVIIGRELCSPENRLMIAMNRLHVRNPIYYHPEVIEFEKEEGVDLTAEMVLHDAIVENTRTKKIFAVLLLDEQTRADFRWLRLMRNLWMQPEAEVGVLILGSHIVSSFYNEMFSATVEDFESFKARKNYRFEGEWFLKLGRGHFDVLRYNTFIRGGVHHFAKYLTEEIKRSCFDLFLAQNNDAPKKPKQSTPLPREENLVEMSDRGMSRSTEETLMKVLFLAENRKDYEKDGHKEIGTSERCCDLSSSVESLYPSGNL